MSKSVLKPSNIEIQDMLALIALSQSNSFSKAAEELNKSQSALSQQIAKLENSLGTILVNREQQNKLTEQGEVLLSYSNQIMKIHHEALNYFINPELKGEIKFGLPEDFATVFLSDILAELNLKYPNVHISVECDLTLNLLKRFHKNHFDLVLVKTTSIDDFPIENEMDVWDEKLVWVCKENSNIDINKVESIPLVLSPKPCVYRARTLDGLESQNLKYKIIYTSPSLIGACAAVKADMGISVLPQNMIPQGLKILEHDKLPDLKNTHISFLLKGDVPNSVRWFADYVISKLKK